MRITYNHGSVADEVLWIVWHWSLFRFLDICHRMRLPSVLPFHVMFTVHNSRVCWTLLSALICLRQFIIFSAVSLWISKERRLKLEHRKCTWLLINHVLVFGCWVLRVLVHNMQNRHNSSSKLSTSPTRHLTQCHNHIGLQREERKSTENIEKINKDKEITRSKPYTIAAGYATQLCGRGGVHCSLF